MLRTRSASRSEGSKFSVPRAASRTRASAAAASSAFAWQQQVESGERVIVGVNKYAAESEQPIELQSIDPAAERRQLERTAKLRAERNGDEAASALGRVRETARGTENMLHPMRDALRARCTIGEICGVLREEWGEHDKLQTR